MWSIVEYSEKASATGRDISDDAICHGQAEYNAAVLCTRTAGEGRVVSHKVCTRGDDGALTGCPQRGPLHHRTSTYVTKTTLACGEIYRSWCGWRVRSHSRQNVAWIETTPENVRTHPILPWQQGKTGSALQLHALSLFISPGPPSPIRGGHTSTVPNGGSCDQLAQTTDPNLYFTLVSFIRRS
jgi:hypothetical protein